jgi:uncharacterized protein (UPF0262 family)
MSDSGRTGNDGHTAVPPSRDRVATLTLDPKSIQRGNSNLDHEREVAIYDILEDNRFAIVGRDDGPYALTIAIADDRLLFTAAPATGGDASEVAVPLVPLRRTMKDYFLVCERYFDAIRSAPPSRIQQIDVGRRALHDEGAKALAQKMADRITVDETTARRLFTLICALHWRG